MTRSRSAAATADDRRAILLAQLDGHTPVSPKEAASLRRTRSLVQWLDAPFDEAADPIHVTASAIVTDGDDRVLLHLHKRLGIWLQPGGHVDADERPEDSVRREVLEETGLVATHHGGGGTPELLHVDVHQGPRGHVHLDVRYWLLADGSLDFAPAPGESTDIVWFTAADAAARSDTSVADAIEAIHRRRP